MEKLMPEQGDQVRYTGPCDPGYWPSLVNGTVEHVGVRVMVRYPWGVHFFKPENVQVLPVAQAA